MKTGKSPGPSEVSLELVAASGKVGIQRLAKYVSLRWIRNASCMDSKHSGSNLQGEG